MSGDLAAYVHLTGHTHRHGISGPAWQEHAHLGGGAPHEHDPETGFQVPVSGYPPELVKAVAEVLHQENCAGTSCTTVLGARHMERARAVLAAAAPLIAAAERERIAALAEQEFACVPVHHRQDDLHWKTTYEPFADLIRQPAPALRDARDGKS